MGKKKVKKNDTPRAKNDSETDTASSGEYLNEKYSFESTNETMQDPADEEYANFPQQVLATSNDICGLTKFYTDEFDAFQKYYSKINQSKDYNSVMHLVTEVEKLPYLSPCDLSEKIKKIPKKDEQNIEVPKMKANSDKIEFAHQSLKLVESRDKGNHLIVTTAVDRGEVLIDERATVLQVDPICVCLENDYKMYRCHHCAYAVHKFYTCAGCNIVLYCSVSCLLQSYNEYHRLECEGFQRHFWKLDDTDYSYMAFRMMLYGSRYNFNREISDNHHKWGKDGNNYPFLYQLQTHFDKMPVQKVYEILKQAARTVTYLLVRTNFFSEFQLENENILHIYVGGLLVKHYCQALMNCVLLKYPNFDLEIPFNRLGGSGKAICPTIALLNHSCAPNAVIVPYNDRILVKAIRPIRLNEEVTIAYHEINSFFSLEERQLLMTDYFYFNVVCNCSLCIHESTWQDNPFKCRNCKTGVAKKVTLSRGNNKLLCKDCQSYSYVDTNSVKTAEIADNATYTLEPVVRVLKCYNNIYPWDSWMILDIYRILYDKCFGWGEKPVSTIKYGLMYFKIVERYLNNLFPPLLEAKLRFFWGVVNTSKFSTLRRVSSEDL